MTLEAKARQTIDRWLVEAGWIVQDYKDRHIHAGPGVAIREFPTTNGPADYLLYLDGKAVGVVEAKAEGHTLTGVETQSAKYSAGLPPNLPRWTSEALDRFGRSGLLPFAYESNGEETRFTSSLDPEPRSREVFVFHRPDELRRLLKLDEQLREKLGEMPGLNDKALWPIQASAVRALEDSLAENRPRALIQMATGSGKTFTAANISYRLVRYAEAKRILFLVDRANLGRQTLREFQGFTIPETKRQFTDEYNVQHLKSSTIAPASRVVISTIQRLYSALKGEEFEEENEEKSQYESADSPLHKEALPVVYNAAIPPEAFDFIIIDECHRSIYNLWRQVLEYFDAFLIGLSATPTKQTIAFFHQNLVEEYTCEQAVRDHVNVGFDVYRIRTKITEQGTKLEAKPGFFVPHRDRRSRKKRYAELDDDVAYSGKNLDRDVVNESQIRLVIKTFRDSLPEIFPGRTEVPKTLVFAKDDSHADDITRIIRDEFAKPNEFCRKITYRTTEGKPEDLLAEFRNSYNPRIAVSVDMIATRTDVKPLECLLFLRNIKSLSYFEQMKGRGCRIISNDALQLVTPDAKQKDRFVIVDAVGVCEEDKSHSRPLNRNPSIKFEALLDLAASGSDHPDVASTLAARLTRIAHKFSEEQQDEIKGVAGGTTLGELVGKLFDAVDADANVTRAAEANQLPPGQEPTEEQLDAAEREAVREALKPFCDPKLRNTILAIKKANEQVFDEQNADELLSAGYDAKAMEKAKTLIGSFRQFAVEHKDEIEALTILYSRPHRVGLSHRHVKELTKAIEREPLGTSPDRLWHAYEAVEPAKVRGKWSDNLADVVALFRHALDPDSALVPVRATVEERYQAWLDTQAAAGVVFTADQRKWLDAIRDHVASNLAIEQDDFELSPFSQFGGLGKANDLFGDRLNAILADLNAALAA